MQDNEIAFSELILQGLDPDVAYTKIHGASSRSAVLARRMHGSRRVKKYLASRQKEVLQRLCMNTDRILTEVASVAMANIADVTSWGNGTVDIKDSSQLPRTVTAAVKEVKVSDKGTELKMHDKMSALTVLLKHRKEEEEWVEMASSELLEGFEDPSENLVECVKGCLKGVSAEQMLKAYPISENASEILELASERSKVRLAIKMNEHLVKGNIAVAEKMAQLTPKKSKITIQVAGEDEVHT
jgi:phage terminase small subunit